MESEPYYVDDSVEIGLTSECINRSSSEIVAENIMECSDLTNNMDVDEMNRSAGKRAREGISPDDCWNTVSRGRKISRRPSQSDIIDKVQVSVTSATVLPKQFAFARVLKENKLKGVSRAKYINPYKMLITFDEDVFADVFINCQALVDLGWRCQRTSEVGLSYGVIKNVELDLADEDIMKNLSCDIEILHVKRLNKRDSVESSSTGWIKSESVRLGFKGSMLPTHVFILGLRIKVEPFVFPVTQCSRCWKFGHTLKMCPSKKVVCPKCSKGHENCKTTTFHCVNCTEDHMALQKVCPVYKKERKLRELMAEFNCTYRKALSLYVPPSPIPEKDSNSVPGPGNFPVLMPQISMPALSTSNTSEPIGGEKLMSDLFKSTADDNGSYKVAQSRKKLRKPRPSRPPTPPPPPMETEELNKDECPDTYSRDDSETAAKAGRSKDFSFIRLLIKLKDILISRESLENKIKLMVSSFTEWIISKIGCGMSASSLMSTFMNVVINEYG